MSNNNDMKLIMEAWRESLKEDSPDQEEKDKASRHIARTVAGERPSGTVYPGTKSGAKDVEALRDLELDPDDFITIKLLDNLKEWYDSLTPFWAGVVDIFDYSGLTDWPLARDSWDKYMEWFMLDDDDTTTALIPDMPIGKDPTLGAELFVTAVVSIILAVPMVDLLGAMGVSFEVPGIGKLKNVNPRLPFSAGATKMVFGNLIKIAKGTIAAAVIILAAGGLHAATTRHFRETKEEMNKRIKILSDKSREARELIEKERNRDNTEAVARWREREKEREDNEEEQGEDSN